MNNKFKDVIEDENKPCWNCMHLDEFGYCKCQEKSPVWITEEDTEGFMCFFDKDKAEELQHIIEYFRKNPGIFAELVSGTRLTWYQNAMLKFVR